MMLEFVNEEDDFGFSYEIGLCMLSCSSRGARIGQLAVTWIC